MNEDLLISITLAIGLTIVIVSIVGTIAYISGYPEWRKMKKRAKEEERFPFIVGDIIIEKGLKSKKDNYWKIIDIEEKQDFGSSEVGKIIQIVCFNKTWKSRFLYYHCITWSFVAEPMYLEEWRKISDIEKFCLENNNK